ncbi:MAG: class I SAM-dependent methyltransferase [Myxococcales bacterium]|nr:class I SAM-dependent methyltransferase [Myxococcales bacterium]MCB9749290.1 class I SAM-dependent methyltransferase [Myxococcales bacterium]
MTLALDPVSDAVLTRLHRRARGEQPALAWLYARQLPSLLLGRGIRFSPGTSARLDDKLIPVGPEVGALLYLLARASGARRVVEFGTSLGVSTIYLACAVRDNGGGVVIGSEIVPEKAAAARRHLEEAGVAEWVELREGDARETLAQQSGPVDMLLLDGFPPLARELLTLLEPRLRPGALVLVDDARLFQRDLGPLRAYLEAPGSGYRSTVLSIDDGLLLAVRGSSSARVIDA